MSKEIKNKGEEHFKFMCNRECEFFPCHKVENPDEFNCLFCYCPLYALGRNCGGNFTYTENGIKDCSGCMVPHRKDAYEHIMSKVGELIDLVKEQEG